MFRINQQSDAKAARSYYTSKSEYYLGGRQELPGTWSGKAASLLGLAGEVGKGDFDAICENRKPDGDRLTARTRAGRTVGYDFNFHCPKSLSVLYALNGDDAILAAFRFALAATLDEMEQAMQTRVRKAGQMADRVTGNMLWSEHIHLTARPVDGVPDPHLHAHAFIFNATWDGVERQWKASKIADIYRDAPYYQAVFHAHLAKTLVDQGYALEKTATGWEIAGLAGILPKFSLRTAEIERIATERGIADPHRKDGLGAETRQRKRKDAGMGELRQLWLARLDDSDRYALAGCTLAASAARRGPSSTGMSPDQAIADAIGQSFASGHASVPEKRLVAAALNASLGTLDADTVRRLLPAHGIAHCDYDGQRFCVRAELRNPSQAASQARDAIRRCGTQAGTGSRFGGMLRAEFDACTSRDAIRHTDAADLPPGLGDRQGSGLHLSQRQRRMHLDAEHAESWRPSSPHPYGR